MKIATWMSLGLVLGLAIGCRPDPDTPTRTTTESWPDGRDKSVEVTRADTLVERLGYHENGQLSVRGGFADGKRHGVWNSYFDSGMPWSQAGYKYGVPHGEYITYHPNGETAIEGVFEDGVRAGLWRFYDEHGVQIRAVAGVEL